MLNVGTMINNKVIIANIPNWCETAIVYIMHIHEYFLCTKDTNNIIIIFCDELILHNAQKVVTTTFYINARTSHFCNVLQNTLELNVCHGLNIVGFVTVPMDGKDIEPVVGIINQCDTKKWSYNTLYYNWYLLI